MRKAPRHAQSAGQQSLPTTAALPPPPPPQASASPRGGAGRRRRGLAAAGRAGALLPAAAALWLLLLGGLLLLRRGGGSRRGQDDRGSGGVNGDDGGLQAALPPYARQPILISYAYYEKDPIQASNFEFFLAVGTSPPPSGQPVRWVFVVSGDNCAPCQGLHGALRQRDEADLSSIGIREAWHDSRFSLLLRAANEGMDLGAHNATLAYLQQRGELGLYAYFVLLNSSVKGPFLPAWLPPGWHWSHAFLARMGGDVHAVGASLVCLPPEDAGGPGPRLESWALALDAAGLAAAVSAGAFASRGCKLCADAGAGIVVGGEYGISAAQFRAGYNVATLMSRYAPGTDWRDPAHWGCNDNVHPSRAGTYGGISFHPFETVFVKSSWHVADVYTRRYARWALQHALGRAGTEGAFDEQLYRYAVSEAAQRPRDLEGAYAPQLPTQPGGGGGGGFGGGGAVGGGGGGGGGGAVGGGGGGAVGGGGSGGGGSGGGAAGAALGGSGSGASGGGGGGAAGGGFGGPVVNGADGGGGGGGGGPAH
ncbi:hypothetical protein Rsub_11299 [Raphidocelis subcapitata]|uniref:Uncharacterized protein n=1 Tax=Raphidocelis subcapitata TaxID=307507 RepID=A0A2V0PFF5_9CHLO|nr:hypothetical protein Rsub_11299 [Raphidocelis subcapitata]|eukprot:GBF98574.1 hypothetical protein Rsub_11299 [Raphidocelis subcapitata]